MRRFSRKDNATTAASQTDAMPSAESLHEDLPAPKLSGTYRIDPRHSHLGFAVRHAMITTVRGTFRRFEATAVVDEAVPERSHVSASIDVASIETGVADRDAHLRTGDFFDVAAYPTMTFVSTGGSRDGDEWTVTGDLTIKGVSRLLTIVFTHTGLVTDPFGITRAGFEGEVTVNRKDWDLSYNAVLETGGMLISDRVKLSFDISAVKES